MVGTLRLILTMFVLGFLTQPATAQYKVEIGVPSILGSPRPGNNFLTRFGFFTHLEKEFDGFNGNIRYYSAPRISKFQKERGIGLGVSKTFFVSQTPQWKYYAGPSLLFIRKRDKRNEFFHRNQCVLGIDLKAEYEFRENIVLSTMITPGLSFVKYKNQPENPLNVDTLYSYYLSIGIGYRFSSFPFIE